MARYEKYGWDEVNYDQKLDKFVPTLYIGLGGTGKDVLMRFRKRLYDKFGACREGFASFLAIDTDDQSDIPRGEKPADFSPVSYARDEFIKCTIDHATFKSIVNRVQTRGDRRYANWLHPEIDTKIGAGSLQTGAGTHRQVGRLAFFNNYNGIRGAIHTQFKNMMAFAADKPSSFFGGVEGEVYTDRLEVVIVTSLAGGTGSGMFIDIAYLVRDILSDADLAKKVKAPHTTVMAILPTVFANSDPNLAARFRQNAYASLLEMEHYNTPRPEENPFKSEEELEKTGEYKPVEFIVNWDDSRAHERAIRHHAWDTCYLIDDVNDPQLVAKRAHGDVYQMIADYLFLDFGASNFAVAKRSARSNHTQLKERILAAQVLDTDNDNVDLTKEDQDRGADVLYESKYGCAFNSFGLSEIYIDKEGVNRSASYRLALQMVLRRWLGEPEQFTDATYDKWTKEDLFSGSPPAGETEAISFHPDDIWKTLLQDTDQNRDWLATMERHFDEIDRADSTDGLAKLQSALATHREALSSTTRADGTRGAARQTLDTRLGELSGTPTELGKMRTRLAQLARQRFNRIGVLPTLKLLEYYHKAFRLGAERARKQQKMKVHSDQEILARLRDAEKVPFPCNAIAKRIEFTRACKKARNAVQQRYEIEAATNLESLANTLRVYVGEPNQDGNAMPIHRSLYSQYQAMREFLEQLAGYLNKRFSETRRAKRSDRREPLLPEWNDDQYDQEINKALLYVGAKGKDAFDWDAVEGKFLAEVKVTSCAELIDRSVEAFNTNRNALDEVAENIAHACRVVLDNRIDLTEFKNGNVVDYLTSIEDRTTLLERLVGASAPYMPSIPPQDRHGISPAYRNLLGRAAGTGPSGPQFTQKLDSDIQMIATNLTQKDGENVQFAEIHSKEEGDPSSLVFVREMGGVPIHFYGRLGALHDAYFDNENREYRKTCHIRFRDDWRNLPDIETIEDGDYQKIQQCVEDVLRALLLGVITYDGDTFVIKVPIPGDFGHHTNRLGARVSRIIKHACEREDIRRHMHTRWSVWKEKATAKDMAVLYNAIQHTQLLFPSVVTAGGREPRIPPVRNCFRKLLQATGRELEVLREEGVAWLDLLRPRNEGVDSDYDTWRPRYDQIANEIREACLIRVPCDNLPIYQIDDKKIPLVKFPHSETEDPSDEQEVADARGE